MIRKLVDSIYLSARFWSSLPRWILRLRQGWKMVAAMPGVDPFCISLSAGVLLWKSREYRDAAVREGTRINVEYQISESTFAQIIKDNNSLFQNYKLSIAVASEPADKPE